MRVENEIPFLHPYLNFDISTQLLKLDQTEAYYISVNRLVTVGYIRIHGQKLRVGIYGKNQQLIFSYYKYTGRYLGTMSESDTAENSKRAVPPAAAHSAAPLTKLNATGMEHSERVKEDIGLHQQPEPQIDPTDQEFISAALQVQSTLKKDDPHYRTVSIIVDYDTCEYVPDDSKDLPLLMDWIALWFAHGENDVVASSVTIEDDDLSIHIALSKGSADETNKNAWTEFKTMLKTILGGDITAQAFGTNYAIVQNAMIKMCWGAISSRIHKLREVVRRTQKGNSNTVNLGRLEGILTSYYYLKEPDSTLQDATLKFLTDILHLPGDGDLTQAKLSGLLEKVFHTCQAAANFAYLKEVDHEDDDIWTSRLENADQALVAELSYAIQRILDYPHGARSFLNWGIPTLFATHFRRGNVARNVDAHLKIKWVNDAINHPLNPVHPKWRTDSAEWLVNLFRITPEGFPTSDDKKQLRDAKIRGTAKDFWKKGDVMATRVHVEIQMVYYLQSKQLTSMYNVIGVSAPICLSCESYFQGIRNVVGRSNQWAIRRSSGKHVRDWLCPPVGDDHPVGRLDWARTAIATTVHGVGSGVGHYLDDILEGIIDD